MNLKALIIGITKQRMGHSKGIKYVLHSYENKEILELTLAIKKY